MKRWRRWGVAPVVLAVVGLSFVSGPAAAKPNPVPPNSKAFGHSLSDWMTRYFEQAFGRDPTGNGTRVIALPLPTGACEGGSFTSADPTTCVGDLDVTLQPGTPFLLPIAAWYGESYNNGTPDDAPLSASVFTDSHVLIELDGAALIDSNVDDLSRWYFGPNYFEPPIVYSEATIYGSISANFVQGLGMTSRPLSRGVHHLSLESEVIAFVEDYYGPGIDLDVGVKYVNTWTITIGG